MISTELANEKQTPVQPPGSPFHFLGHFLSVLWKVGRAT
jgi:hypothetical protein